MHETKSPSADSHETESSKPSVLESTKQLFSHVSELGAGYLGFNGFKETVDGITVATSNRSGNEGCTVAVTNEQGEGVGVETRSYKPDSVQLDRLSFDPDTSMWHFTRVVEFVDGSPPQMYEATTAEKPGHDDLVQVVAEVADIDAFVSGVLEEAEAGVSVIKGGEGQRRRDKERDLRVSDRISFVKAAEEKAMHTPSKGFW